MDEMPRPGEKVVPRTAPARPDEIPARFLLLPSSESPPSPADETTMRRPRITLRAVVIGIALAEGAVLIGLGVYLAASDQALVIDLVPRATLRAAEESARLTIPVAGVREEELKDSWGAARSGGRAHKGVDIFAPAGTPVLAAAEAVLVRADTTGAGGNALYLRGMDGRTVYYYAHLQRFRAGLRPGDLVRRGEVIGFVGSTGNVSGSPHLHFGVSVVADPNRVGRGRDLNPYPLLRGGR